MANTGHPFLEKMLERLYSALASGPLLNCRPHNSRQRICLTELDSFDGPRPGELIRLLLTEPGKARLTAPSAKVSSAKSEGREARDPNVTLWNKLKTITSDAAAYEKETGAQALFIGYPLLYLPPATSGTNSTAVSKRVIAPVAFIPVAMRLNNKRSSSVEFESIGDGAELVIANQALLAWAQQVTGTRTGELFIDEAGVEPYREINEIVAALSKILNVTANGPITADSAILPVPKSDTDGTVQAQFLASAVLGLYPLSNQSLLRDLEALVEGEPAVGPVRAFLDAKAELGKGEVSLQTASMQGGSFAPNHVSASAGVGDDRTITEVDPCQRRAVLLARSASGLVLHGPPGTGKSQTISNVIADHLAQGKRVLFVCDKRTALDVVHSRLHALKLSHLCAVVHDSRRDEKELYRAMREQLDGLGELTPEPNVVAALEAADLELKRLHAELSAYAKQVTERHADGSASFQELLGLWLSIEVEPSLRLAPLGHVTLAQLELSSRTLNEILGRGVATRYPENPWVRGVGISLSGFLGQAPEVWRQQLANLLQSARALDAVPAEALPLNSAFGLAPQIQARQAIIATLSHLMQNGALVQLAYWAAAEPLFRGRAAAEVLGLLPVATVLYQSVQDYELAQALAQQPLPNTAELLTWSAALGEYINVGEKWYGAVYVGRQQAARDIVARFGQPLGPESAKRVAAFVELLKLRRRLFDWYTSLFGPVAIVPPDQTFLAALQSHRAVFQLLDQIAADPTLAPLCSTLFVWLREPARVGALLGALQDSCTRAERLLSFEQVLSVSSLLNRGFLTELRHGAHAGRLTAALVEHLINWHGSLEGVLRIFDAMGTLPQPLQVALGGMLARGIAAESGCVALKKAVLEGELTARIASAPWLPLMDEGRLQSAYESYRRLSKRRQELSQKLLDGLWRGRQRERLVANGGGRLSPLGAELKRRFVSRGENAMRLRQAVAVGTGVEGGDPLFDLRPVWMVSPEVAAQIFPRRAIFDLLVFDEASQCRVEEALPVMLRAHRVLIAGDPQQLPPTRFFESAAALDDGVDAETEQQLFEMQQAQVEDLLTAALNLSIEQAYLDVHYRSKNPDLIAFSNQHFYSSRLEPLPKNPDHRTAEAPICLLEVGGVYDKRVNLKETLAVVELVKQLLGQEPTPSIGIACFNLSQRDAIVAALEDAALADEAFAEQLETARNRQGEGTFEGLFVKNLENVQGDERDHLIISTTYGPDPQGRFYRRFGPLAQTGGGRRLNVLITRARQRIHLLTSIPKEIYRAVPPLENGAKPNGAWLLLSYLAFAEEVGKKYTHGQDTVAPLPSNAVVDRQAPAFAAAISAELSRRGFVTQAPWGTAGLGTDLLVTNATPTGRSIGLVCDITGYPRAPDAVEWDVFRQSVLERQGFTLLRVLSPRLLRDFDGELTMLHNRLTEQGRCGS